MIQTGQIGLAGSKIGGSKSEITICNYSYRILHRYY